jgi:putative ABC transport system permease protein
VGHLDIDIIKKHIVSKSVLFLLLSLFFMLLAVNVLNTFDKSGDMYVKRLELVRKNDPQVMSGGDLYLEGAERAAKYLRKVAISYAARKDTLLFQDGFFPYPVQLVLTNHSHVDFLDIRLIRGAFFTEEASDKGRNETVIGSRMAYDFFYRYDVIGETIEISGKEYVITGVYENNKSLAAILGEDGIERIYIPFRSVDGYEKIPIETLHLYDPSLKESVLGDYRITADLRERAGLNFDAFDYKNYYACVSDLLRYTKGFVFILGIFGILLLARLLFKITVRCLAVLKNSYNDYYFFQLLYVNKLYILKALLIVSAFAASIVLIFNAVRFNPNILPEYVPPDNIFDFGFYFNRIKESLHLSNSPYKPVPTLFALRLSYTSKLYGVFLICSVASFCLYRMFAKMLKKSGESFKYCVKCILISFPAAFALSSAVSLLCGLHISIPGKELAVIASFLILSALKGQQAEEKLLALASRQGTGKLWIYSREKSLSG